MQIVIDVPNWLYNAIMECKEPQYSKSLGDAVRDGTPLPKGHGRLIDADELKTFSYEVLIDTDNPNTADGLSACNGIVEDDIDLAQTIIEADTESEGKE